MFETATEVSLSLATVRQQPSVVVLIDGKRFFFKFILVKSLLSGLF